MTRLKWTVLFLCAYAVVDAPKQSFAADYVVINKVEPNKVNPGQSLATLHRIDIRFAYSTPDGETVGGLILRNVNKNWDCHAGANFDVVVNPGPHQAAIDLRVQAVTYDHATTCAEAFRPDDAKQAHIFVDIGERNIVGKVTVRLKNLVDAQDKSLQNVGSATDSSPISWPLSLLTVSAQTAQNETLIDKTVSKNTLYQIPISATINAIPTSRGGVYVETKDLFSTDERDSKSSFQGGGGFQYGLSKSKWSYPLKLEEDMVGNQIASNLASETSFQVSVIPAWGDRLEFGNSGPGWDSPPTVTVALPYTHRINQYVAPTATPLPQDDFAMNPGIALTKERLVEIGGNGASIPATFSLSWEADLGMYFLPLETTAGGTKRAEGTGDVSVLIPLTDFGILRGVTLDPATQASQMQIRVKYQDSVDATNNYTRTKGWTFGLELSVK